jgi:hypothetical protein
LEATTSGVAYSGQNTLSGYVGDGRFAQTRGDVDLYYVPAWHGSLVTVDVNAAVGGSPLDSVVVIMDYLGSVIADNDNDGITTDSLLTFQARQPDAIDPADFYVMVMGTRQARPLDPLVPNPGFGSFEVRPSEHVVVDASPSTGAYDVTIDIVCDAGCNNCCVPHPGPGCTVPEVEACVCTLLPACCTGDWSTNCAEAVWDEGCGQCPPDLPAPAQAAWSPPPLPSVPDPPPHRIFASTVDDPPEAIVELDPDTADVVNVLPPPEPVVRVGQGLALTDAGLFYLGHGRFPRLYQMDADTGDVIDDVILWSGSGYYGDLAVLSGHLFFTDILRGSLHQLDPLAMEAVRTLDVGTLNNITVFGPLASLACPDRLYLAEAGDVEAVHAISPATGLIDASLSPGVPCPCDADFDGDGDVDADDQTFFDDCQTGDGSVQFFCHQADLDCDNDIDVDDQTILDCQNNGSGLPPNDGCCPDGLPEVPLRADALGGSGSDRLYISEWRRNTIELYLDGVLQEVFPMGTEVGALGGQPFADCVADRDDSQGDIPKLPSPRIGGNQR